MGIELDDWNDEDAVIVYSYEANTAAEKFYEINFSNLDYPRTLTMFVRKYGESVWKKFEAYVESVPSFTAVEVEDKNEKKITCF